MKKALQQDVFVFSALKTHTQLLEASRLLLDSEGKVKGFQEFKKDFESITTKYNEQYLEAEYQFAKGSSIMAGKWSEFDHRYNIQYRTAKDSKVRDEHRALDEITLPYDDAFWREYFPPNGWNCRCTAVEVRKEKYEENDSALAIEKGKVATTQIDKEGNNKLAIFRFNPGMDKVVFPPNHPYSKVKGAKEVQEIAKGNFEK